MRVQAARAASIAGHPALLVPAAAILSAAWRQPTLLPAVAGVVIGLAAATMAWAAVQVRRSRWRHIDASRPQERRPLLVALAVLLAAVGTLLPAALAPLRAGLLCGSAILAAALLASPWMKPSLHTAFALLAAAILAVVAWAAGVAALALAVGIGWSRVVLGRHSLAEVLVGGAFGAAAGATLVAIV